MAGKFESLREDNALFKILSDQEKCPQWWKDLIIDRKDLVIEVRKDNYIDVYYRGGAIIKELKYYQGRWSGKIHIAYVPYGNKPPYVNYVFNDLEDPSKPNFVPYIYEGPKDCFSSGNLKKIKERIGQYFSDGSEKALQSELLLNHKFFLDSEFAYSTKDTIKNLKDEEAVAVSSEKFIPGLIRIDLVKLDVEKKRIVFIELKRASDNRLSTREIVDQLTAYQDFIKENNGNGKLKNYYKKVFNIKNALNILPEGIKNIDMDEYVIESKPVLLVVKEKGENLSENFEGNLQDRIKEYAYLKIIDSTSDKLDPLY